MDRRLPIFAALAAVYVLWGATYLGIKVAVETIPPFLMAGIRFLAAGLLVYGFTALRRARRPRLEHWVDAGKVGALMLLGGNGVVSWAERRVPSGIAALMVATVPLWMILLALPGKGASRPRRSVVLGLALGFAGIALLVMPTGPLRGGFDLPGIFALLAASCAWALGSLQSRRSRLPESPLMAVGMQMIVGGALLLAFSGLMGEWRTWEASQVSLRSLAGLAYLVVFGSIVAYNAYIWLLKNADPTWVSTYAFVNPVVAILLGWLLAGERLTPRSGWATGVILLAVVIITIARNREARAR
jgi:drug/metabolite transporter (DMT)-like permease